MTSVNKFNYKVSNTETSLRHNWLFIDKRRAVNGCGYMQGELLSTPQTTKVTSFVSMHFNMTKVEYRTRTFKGTDRIKLVNRDQISVLEHVRFFSVSKTFV